MKSDKMIKFLSLCGWKTKQQGSPADIYAYKNMCGSRYLILVDDGYCSVPNGYSVHIYISNKELCRSSLFEGRLVSFKDWIDVFRLLRFPCKVKYGDLV